MQQQKGRNTHPPNFLRFRVELDVTDLVWAVDSRSVGTLTCSRLPLHTRVEERRESDQDVVPLIRTFSVVDVKEYLRVTNIFSCSWGDPKQSRSNWFPLLITANQLFPTQKEFWEGSISTRVQIELSHF